MLGKLWSSNVGRAVLIGGGVLLLIGIFQAGGRRTGQVVIPTLTVAARVPAVAQATEPPAPTEAPAPTRAPRATRTPEPTETPQPTATPFVLPTRNPALKAEGVPPLNKDDCPKEYPIKGNIGNNGKIYHSPGSSSYRQTDPEICFAYSADAEAQGFRAP